MMTENTNQYVSIAVAMQELEVSDEKDFIQTAKKHNCYRKIGGVVRINLPELKRLIEEDFAKADERAAKRKGTTRSAGSDYGLVEARLVKYPDRIAKKQAKITEAEAEVKAAQTPYHRHQAQKKLTKLHNELKALIEGQKRDEQRRDEFLNGNVQ
jgi:hypothetical protein